MSHTGHGFRLARLVITCCAADARPFEVEVRTAGPAPPRGSWNEVTGIVSGSGPAHGLVPIVSALGVRSISVPEDPYE